MSPVARVVDEGGDIGRMMTSSAHTDDDGTVLIALDDAREVVVPTERVTALEDGSYRLDGRFADFEIAKTPGKPGQDGAERGPDGGDGHVRVPVARERVSVTKQRRPVGKVRVTKRVEEEQVLVDEQLSVERAEIERVPVERVVDAPPPTRREGDTIVVPIVEERLVKQLVVIEEVRISRAIDTEDRSEPITLRRERVDVDRQPPGSSDEPERGRPRSQ
jgi:stress response protein YsnF